MTWSRHRDPASDARVTADGASELTALPRFVDRRGNLAFVEGQRHIPFAVHRAYWIDEERSRQAHDDGANCDGDEFFIALYGRVEMHIGDPADEHTVVLEDPSLGLLVPGRRRRRLGAFSHGAVCLVLTARQDISARDRRI